MKRLLFIFTLFITYVSFAQLENAKWCFKNQAGVNFTIPPNPTAINCAIVADMPFVNAASVSDNNGNLLFYTNGNRVWDKNHIEMPNGNSLYGGTSESYDQQGLIIVPKPGSNRLYYIFSATSTPNPANYNTGFFYSVVDIDPSVNNGNGDVITKNIPLNNHNGIPIHYDFFNQTGQLQLIDNSLTSTLNEQGDAIWVSLFAGFVENGLTQRRAYQYLITANGINNGLNLNPTTNFALDNINYPNGSGALGGHSKFSPNGNLLCNANFTGVTLYSFDRQTGFIQIPGNNIFTTSGGSGSGFGLEFSPQGNLIYFSCTDNIIIQNKDLANPSGNQGKIIRIRQYDIDKPENPPVIIGSIQLKNSDSLHSSLVPIPVNYTPFNIQRAINDILYVAQGPNAVNGGEYLGAITSPNTPGIGCNFVSNALQLNPNTGSYWNLPQWVHKATVNNVWPKVYSYARAGDPGPFPSQSFPFLVAGVGSNFYYGLTTHDMSININHNGNPVPTNPGTYTVQYNKVTGQTSWIHQNMIPKFVLNSGIVQVLTSPFTPMNTLITTECYDPSLGILVPSPVPNNQVILAEDNGTYITRSTNSLYVHSLTGSTSKSFEIGYSEIDRTIYYPITINNPKPKLFVQYRGSIGYGLAVYELDVNTNILQLINSVSPNSGFLVQVNNVGEIFCLYSGRIQKYNYVSNSYIPLSIVGFNNFDIQSSYACNPYLNDRILVSRGAENKLYYINTNPFNLQQKSIPYTRQYSPEDLTCIYYFEGDDLYMEVGADAEIMTIGNQTIPPLGNAVTGVTKFNIQTDFSFRQSNEERFQIIAEASKTTMPVIRQIITEEETLPLAIEATLSPNPAKNNLVINIKQKGKEAVSSFIVSLTNALGVNVLTKTTKQNILTVDISGFRTGIYYVTILTDKGEKNTQTFIKE